MLTNDDMEYSVNSQVGCVYTIDVHFCTSFQNTHITISDVTSNEFYLKIANNVD